MASPSLPPSSNTTPTSGIGSDTPPAAIVPDEDPGVDLPMTMSASVILTNLPRDASQALSEVEALDKGKGMYYIPRCTVLMVVVAAAATVIMAILPLRCGRHLYDCPEIRNTIYHPRLVFLYFVQMLDLCCPFSSYLYYVPQRPIPSVLHPI